MPYVASSDQYWLALHPIVLPPRIYVEALKFSIDLGLERLRIFFGWLATGFVDMCHEYRANSMHGIVPGQTLVLQTFNCPDGWAKTHGYLILDDDVNGSMGLGITGFQSIGRVIPGHQDVTLVLFQA